jgi:hypothetical protein
MDNTAPEVDQSTILNCRFYEDEYPEEDQLVMVNRPNFMSEIFEEKFYWNFGYFLDQQFFVFVDSLINEVGRSDRCD